MDRCAVRPSTLLGLAALWLVLWVGDVKGHPINSTRSKTEHRRSLLQSSTQTLSTGLIIPGRDELTSFAVSNYFRYADVEAAASFDWRPKLRPAVDQQTCGSCWAQAASAAMEGMVAAFTPGSTPMQFSAQELLECASERFPANNLGCTGGWPGLAMNHAVLTGGPVLEKDAPYKNAASPKSVNCKQVKRFSYPVEGVGIVPSTVDALKQAVNKQPIVVLVHSGPIVAGDPKSPYNFPPSGYSKPTEIWRGCSKTVKNLDHVVLLVGYGKVASTGEEYWIIRNSWGTDWMDKGHVKLPITKNGTDYTDDADGGPCGMQVFQGSFPVVSTEENQCGTYNLCGMAGTCKRNTTRANGYSCNCVDGSKEASFSYTAAGSTQKKTFTTCAIKDMCDWWGPELSCGNKGTCVNDMSVVPYWYTCRCAAGFKLTQWAEDGSPGCVADAALTKKTCPAGTKSYAVQTYDNCFTVRRAGAGLKATVMSEAAFTKLNPNVNCYVMLAGQQLCVPDTTYNEAKLMG